MWTRRPRCRRWTAPRRSCRWLLRHARFHLHFTPTYSSWLNLVERWFAELISKWLKRGTHRSVAELTGSIQAWIDTWNQNLRPFVWTKTADQILETSPDISNKSPTQDTSSLRTTLLQGLGGAAVLLGVYFTFRQLRIARDGQVTERFTRAVDQLGNRSDDIQLGGVYALQQIGRASAEERGAIQEILAAYVRIHAPWNSPHDEGAVDVGAIPRLREWAPAVQAAMLALGRRDRATPVDPPLGLMGVNLRRIRLSDTDIPGGANLAAVLFWRSSLINAAIRGADLRGAALGWTDLRYARLERADFSGSDLRGADLRHATLDGADLGGADLRGADLRDIDDLHRADLTGATADARTKWPEGFEWRAAGVLDPPA